MSSAAPDDDVRISETTSLCARGLDGLGDGFLKAFHAHEGDFLRLGRLLDSFSTQARDVSDVASELTGMIFGEALLGASSKLSSHLDRLIGAYGASCSGREASGLAQVSSLGAKLTESMRDFGRLVKHLSMLGIATRIESARLGSQGLGFSTLADDVETLAGKIVISSDKILKRAQALTAQCREATQRIEDMDRMRQNCTESAMGALRTDLQALEGLVESSRSVASGISGEAEEVVKSVSEAVLSMQFHDIIRQQLEHVAEASDEARNMALEGPGTEGGHNAADWTELAGWISSVLVLQLSQLGNARARFGEAMQSLESSLESIAGRVQNTAAHAGSLADQESGQGAILVQIEGEVGGIAQSLRDYAGLERSMSGVMREVAESIADMSASVSEIEEVGSEIELIALNASVKAAHTGEEGKALGVLASAIQKLSVDARGQTDSIMALLGSVDASSLSDQSEGEACSSVVDEIVADLDVEVGNLKSIEAQTGNAAKRVQKLASELSGQIASAVESLRFHYDLVDLMTAAEARLQELVEALAGVLPSGMEGAQSPRLREMLERYTMEAERLVHEQVLGVGGPGEAADEGEYGGNVELF